MRRWLWGLIPLAVTAALIGVFASRFGHDPRYIPSPLVNEPAPRFSLPQLYQPDQNIDNTTFAGKVVLFNVFASWCVACVDESSSLDYLRRHGVAIYGLDVSDSREAAKAWLKRWGDPYEAIAFDQDGEQAANWGTWGVPETYVIDRQGLIVHKYTGPITSQAAKTEVLPLVRRLEGSG
jgi:cytochrome c biogenesis protein CcmG, thiol:disulfide interchange protein DsbE